MTRVLKSVIDTSPGRGSRQNTPQASAIQAGEMPCAKSVAQNPRVISSAQAIQRPSRPSGCGVSPEMSRAADFSG